MSDLISRQAAIDAISTPHGILYPIRTVEELPSAQPDNQIHLCDSFGYSYPECPSESNDVIFGNGKGNDNICACGKYKPSAQPMQRGWICPVCGRGLSPLTMFCPCQNGKGWEITCKT